MTRYNAPDTSDKDPDETWQEYWDKKMDEMHGEGCKCPIHELRRILEEHPEGCTCLPCAANRYWKEQIQ